MSRKTALARTLALIPLGSGAGPLALAADLQIGLGRYEEALKMIGERLGRDPYDDRLHALKARALLSAGRGADAESAIDRALALHPGGKSHIALKVRILSSLGRSDEALRLVEASLRNKQSVELRFLKARIAVGQFWRASRSKTGLAGSLDSPS
jgi:tetratricopeptide (TPR) repeat protein